MPEQPTLKLWHVALAGLSGALFVARGAASLANPAWRPRGLLRAVPHAIDTLLLAAGVALAWQLGLAATRGWLGAKLVAVAVYVVLGSVALSLKRGTGMRAAAFAGACATFAYVAAVAVTRSPAGFFALL